jgi:G3E family GTPase
VPVTILGGYLGAGKTTLINALLAADHGRRLAVLVNDFGAVNIDVELIERHDGETISLTNGCICCSIADSLGESLDQVLALEPRPDQIIIEASGVADPATIAGYGEGWPGCRLDAVVVLVDAEAIRRQARDQFVGELVTRQLTRGDLVLLTKTDLLPEDEVQTVVDWVGAATSSPVVVPGEVMVDPTVVLDIEATGSFPATAPVAAHELFESAVLEPPCPVLRSRIEEALDTWPSEIVRVKGVVSIVDVDGVVESRVVHRVGLRWSIDAAPVDRSERSYLVVIGLIGAVDAVELLRNLT